MNKNYTIKDIANLAGVSKGTVDRVLHKRGRVSQKALDKVNSVLSEIDYQPNLIARNLKNNKTYRICILLPDPKFDPYWVRCDDGIKDAVKEFKAYKISVETFYFNPQSTKEFLEINKTILESLPDAVLLVPLLYKETIDVVSLYSNSGIIVTTFNNKIQSNLIQGFVGQDLIQSGRVAAKLMSSLLNRGQIAIIHIDEKYKNAVHMQEKEKGFRNYFSEQSDSAYEIVTFKLKHPNFESSLLNFLKKHSLVSGIFVTTSKAYQVAEIFAKNKLDKIVIVGYDLLDRNIDYLQEGYIDFLINQNPKMQSLLSITNLVEHFIFDKEIPNTKLLPIDIINSENATLYIV